MGKMGLPSRGWGPWRQEFYSLHSNPEMIKADADHRIGMWRNVWVGKLSHAVYARWPEFWCWWVNLPFVRSGWQRRLRKFFPNL